MEGIKASNGYFVKVLGAEVGPDTNSSVWATIRGALANAIFDYLEIFQNRQRRHSALGMLTPIE